MSSIPALNVKPRNIFKHVVVSKIKVNTLIEELEKNMERQCMKELQVARVQTTHIVDLRQQRTAFFTVYTGTDKRMRTFRVSKGAGVWFSFDGGCVRWWVCETLLEIGGALPCHYVFRNPSKENKYIRMQNLCTQLFTSVGVVVKNRKQPEGQNDRG